MNDQGILSETKAYELVNDPRFGLDEDWHTPAVAQALSCSGPFENMPALGNAIRAFMNSRTTPSEIERFSKLWTSLNALRNHITARFEAAQAEHLRLEPGKLPKRYRIQMMDYASLKTLATIIDPAHPLPRFGDLRSRAFVDAQRELGNLAESLLCECKQNPRGALAQLTEAPRTSASSKPHANTNGSKVPTATEKLFSLTKELETSPLLFVMLIASYELRNGIAHGSIPLPLSPDEQCDELAALELCTLVLGTFLDEVIPQTVGRLDGGNGCVPPFPEEYRQAIACYLDHRFDGEGIIGVLRKHGLI